jgi:hypothetical protein
MFVCNVDRKSMHWLPTWINKLRFESEASPGAEYVVTYWLVWCVVMCWLVGCVVMCWLVGCVVRYWLVGCVLMYWLVGCVIY